MGQPQHFSLFSATRPHLRQTYCCGAGVAATGAISCPSQVSGSSETRLHRRHSYGMGPLASFRVFFYKNPLAWRAPFSTRFISGGRLFRSMDCRAQTSTEYILLVALGLVVVLAGIAVATQIKGVSDVVTSRISSDRNRIISMFVTQ